MTLIIGCPKVLVYFFVVEDIESIAGRWCIVYLFCSSIVELVMQLLLLPHLLVLELFVIVLLLQYLLLVLHAPLLGLLVLKYVLHLFAVWLGQLSVLVDHLGFALFFHLLVVYIHAAST